MGSWNVGVANDRSPWKSRGGLLSYSEATACSDQCFHTVTRPRCRKPLPGHAAALVPQGRAGVVGRSDAGLLASRAGRRRQRETV